MSLEHLRVRTAFGGTGKGRAWCKTLIFPWLVLSDPVANTQIGDLSWQSRLRLEGYRGRLLCPEPEMHRTWKRRWLYGSRHRICIFRPAFLARTIGDAHADTDGSMTPAASMSSISFCSASPDDNGGFRGDCRMGGWFHVLMSCCKRLQYPMSSFDLANVVSYFCKKCRNCSSTTLDRVVFVTVLSYSSCKCCGISGTSIWRTDSWDWMISCWSPSPSGCPVHVPRGWTMTWLAEWLISWFPLDWLSERLATELVDWLLRRPTAELFTTELTDELLWGLIAGLITTELTDWLLRRLTAELTTAELTDSSDGRQLNWRWLLPDWLLNDRSPTDWLLHDWLLYDWLLCGGLLCDRPLDDRWPFVRRCSPSNDLWLLSGCWSPNDCWLSDECRPLNDCWSPTDGYWSSDRCTPDKHWLSDDCCLVGHCWPLTDCCLLTGDWLSVLNCLTGWPTTSFCNWLTDAFVCSPIGWLSSSCLDWPIDELGVSVTDRLAERLVKGCAFELRFENCGAWWSSCTVWTCGCAGCCGVLVLSPPTVEF